jgi:pimeloyl-ACP methyl ester carboxylesterase
MPVSRRRQVQAPGIIRMPRWLAVLASVLGTILGLATNLYSTQFRDAIAASGRHISSAVVSAIIAAVVTSAATAFIYRWLVRRSQRNAQILPGEIKIQSDILDALADEHDSVVGRSLHYLEAKRDSSELVVFLHGLGLDANDFRPYMAESKFHCVALTLYGFNEDEKDDDRYRPISLQTHVQLLAYALKALQESNPRKRMALVGFSFGADVIFFLVQYCIESIRALKVSTALLLDPNVNCTTTTISSRIARVDENRPLGELVKILDSAGDVSEFRNLCEYLYKITSKNFAQIQRHAKDILEMWGSDSYDNFLDRMGQLARVTEEIHVVLSFDYESHFNTIARGAVGRGLDPTNLECSRYSHFELIGPRFLKDRLEGVLWREVGHFDWPEL